MKVLGIDIGGSAFKGAPVDTKTGKLLAERHRVEIDAPCPTAQGLAAAREIARHFNDADAAGLAEMKFGAGRGHQGSVLMLTFGTGIGSALFFQGRLMPNIEFGHIPWKGKPIERFASAAVKKRRGLTWQEWALRVNVFFAVAERLCSPELIIIGGGVSKKPEKWFKYLKANARIVPARMNNDAGIVGAALAWEQTGR